MTEYNVIENGGVCSASGFKAAGVHGGFRRDPSRLDFALVSSHQPCPTAGVFTQNVFCAAPVTVSREHLDNVGYGMAKAVIVNSGLANAATGSIGLENARESAQRAACVLGCVSNEVLVASTGIIGQQLNMAPFDVALPSAFKALSEQGGTDAAHAIMTTDTVAKQAAVEYVSTCGEYSGTKIHVGGMAKGSGMIMPNMATMISVITTDAPLDAPAAHAALVECVNSSFNKVTVDSDTSTNDTCFLMASGKAAPHSQHISVDTPAFREFVGALKQVCTSLARQMATDGEGATKLVTVNVTGAATDDDADAAARTIANSPLVKTAIAGHDANWGRIAAAAGRSGAKFSQEKVDIDIVGLPVLRAGLPVSFSETEALERFEEPEIVLDVCLGAGDCSTTLWTCDFTHEYISINGDYRS